MENKPPILLWLDDQRDPFSNDWSDWLSKYSPIRDSYFIVWVKNYNAFVDYVKSQGLPGAICLDRDLGEDVAKEKVKNGVSKRQARKQKKETKSGMDCAKWLVEYCLDNDLELPPYRIQSANPAGRDNIDGLLKSFNNRTK